MEPLSRYARLCHLPDHGGLRRATLRGCEKLTKRHIVVASAHNLSLLLRHLFGMGTPKQALAAAWDRLSGLISWLWHLVSTKLPLITATDRPRRLCRTFFQTQPGLQSVAA